jgi:anti-sigma B factor antagonist
MTINVERDYELVTLKITGRLDTTTTPNLETVINELSDSVKELVFNVSEIEYISSYGIRAMLKAYKKMTSNHGIMRIEQVNNTVREAFEMMGLAKMIG